jgi:predicted ATPase
VVSLPASLDAASRPLVGRASDLAWLEVLWGRSRAQAYLVALMTGEAGIGKTRLVVELARKIRADDMPVTYKAVTDANVTTVLMASDQNRDISGSLYIQPIRRLLARTFRARSSDYLVKLAEPQMALPPFESHQPLRLLSPAIS